MFQLFFKLTSRTPQVRLFQEDQTRNNHASNINADPLFTLIGHPSFLGPRFGASLLEMIGPPACQCGEPLNININRAAKDLFQEPPAFDPLEFLNKGRVRALSVFVASIVLSIALAESISQSGVLLETFIGVQ